MPDRRVRLCGGVQEEGRLRSLGANESCVLRVRHQSAVDPEGRQLDVVHRPLVVVCPRIRGAQRERTARDENLPARLDLRQPLRRVTVKACERERLRHRLAVLELVLRHHPNDEPVLEKRITTVGRQFGEEGEHSLAHLLDIRTCCRRRQDRQPAALAARVSERVVELVVLGRDRIPSACPAQEPELLEVTDVREIPDERRLERRDLPRELLVRERVQQRVRPPSRMLERSREVSR
jgi:hypothetical protein